MDGGLVLNPHDPPYIFHEHIHIIKTQTPPHIKYYCAHAIRKGKEKESPPPSAS